MTWHSMTWRDRAWLTNMLEVDLGEPPEELEILPESLRFPNNFVRDVAVAASSKWRFRKINKIIFGLNFHRREAKKFTYFNGKGQQNFLLFWIFPKERFPVNVQTTRPPASLEDQTDEITEVDVSKVVEDWLDDSVIIDIRPVNNLVLVGRDQPGGEDMLDQIRSDQFLPFKRVSDPGEGDRGLGQAPETRLV